MRRVRSRQVWSWRTRCFAQLLCPTSRLEPVHKNLAAVLVTATFAVTLAACGLPAEAEPATRPVSSAPAPSPPPTADPEPVLPVADEFSQVIDGVLYQGTQKAPVRIGTDTPGQPPAAEAGYPSGQESWDEYAQQADKYVVTMAPGYSDNAGGTNGGHVVGWLWKVFGLSQHGSFRELDNSGYQAGTYLPTREAVLAGPYTVDGRVLERAEYIQSPINDRYAGIG